MTFKIILIICSICGFMMVSGGIVLLYKGIITLAATPSDKALSIEFKKYFRLTTQYPALGIFLIGLAFVLVALIYAKPPLISSIEFRGRANNVRDHLKVFVQADQWPVSTSSQGRVHGVIHPNLDILWVKITAPGYRPIVTSVSNENIINGVADLGEISLERVVDEIQTDPTQISSLPDNFNASSLNEGGSFGGTR
ncbi:MAG: hypothetical protein MJE63_26000 [Proteobacteria bacterium]|nr:hypothetical protein [Pseudomonadota bacterium]